MNCVSKFERLQSDFAAIFAELCLRHTTRLYFGAAHGGDGGAGAAAESLGRDTAGATGTGAACVAASAFGSNALQQHNYLSM